MSAPLERPVEWPANPVVYEVNTAVWLREISARYGSTVTLADVPAVEWDDVVQAGITVVWLMGVWERSAAGREIALENPDLRASWDVALPGWDMSDVAGSPYCIREYIPDVSFGGWPGLDVARAELRKRGALLMVDWVPNHLGPDSPWLVDAPDAFVQGDADDLARDPKGFLEVGGRIFARGKDPYFPPWPDVVQVDAFSPTLRSRAIATLTEIAAHADVVRCDMAMLMLDDVVVATWGDRVGPPPATTYWRDVIDAVQAARPGFRFVAEAYWDREFDLQRLGFVHCYDKRLYDRLSKGDPDEVRGHLGAGLDYQNGLVRFLENHDEPRAAATFRPRERAMACATAIATLPGLTLWHEGQEDGRTTFLPVFLSRRPDEALDGDLAQWYRALWNAAERIRVGDWRRCDVTGWPDNGTCSSLLAWSWSDAGVLNIVVANLAPTPADGLVHIDSADGSDARWRFTDLLDGTTYDRDASDLWSGLYVSRPGWGAHMLAGTPID